MPSPRLTPGLRRLVRKLGGEAHVGWVQGEGHWAEIAACSGTTVVFVDSCDSERAATLALHIKVREAATSFLRDEYDFEDA